MTNEAVAFAGLTVTIILGSLVLLAGVAELGTVAIGVGGAVMVLGVLGLAAYTSALPEAEGGEGETGH